MPHLVYCGRLWRLASDELSVPSACAAMIRVFWTVLLIVIIGLTSNLLSGCSKGWIILLYLIFSIVVSILSVICELCIARISIKGSLVEGEGRNSMFIFLNSHIVLGIMQLFCAIFGQFDSDVVVALLYLVIISQIVDISGIICCWSLFSSRSASLDDMYRDDEDERQSRAASIMDDGVFKKDVTAWEGRCRSTCRRIQLCTCGLFGGSAVAEDLEAVGRIFSTFFHHEGFLDVVPSDVVTGVMLVRFQQKLTAIQHREQRIRKLMGKVVSVKAYGSTSPSDKAEGSEGKNPANGPGADISSLKHNYPPAVAAAATMVFSAASVQPSPRFLAHMQSSMELSPPMNPHAMIPTRSSYLSALELLHNEHFELELSDESDSDEENQSVSGPPGAQNDVDITPVGIVNSEYWRKSLVASDFAQMAEVAHYSHYGLAAYSTLMYLYVNPCTGMCRLCCCSPSLKFKIGGGNQSCCCCCARKGNGLIVGDNPCALHESAVLKMAHLDKSELIYANFANDISIRPYAVFVDFEKHTLVVTIRGTLSLEDCVTDAQAEPQSLEEAGLEWGFDGRGRYAHSGMLKSALWIRNDMNNTPRVADLLAGVAGACPRGGAIDRYAQGKTCIEMPLNQPPMTFNQLVVVGHSLGAGAAAVLGLLLKKEYPTVKVYGYGTPGSVMDKVTASEMSEYMTSCVLGNDIVASLSMKTLSDMREKVLDSIARCRVNKMVVMQTAMFKDHINSLDPLMYRPGEEPRTNFRIMVDKYKDHMRNKQKAIGMVTLHHPGAIIHMRKIGKETQQCGCIPSPIKTRVFAPFRTNMKHFNEIVISSSMVMDHLPDRYCDQLDLLVRDWSAEREGGSGSRAKIH